MDSIILNQAGRDFRKHLRPEKGDEVLLKSSFVARDIDRAALALGDCFELIEKPSSRLLERLA